MLGTITTDLEYASPQRGPRDASVAGCPSRGRRLCDRLQARRARSPDFAGAVFRRGGGLPVLVWGGGGAEGLVDVPLILHLGRLLGAGGGHFPHPLVFVRNE